MSLALLKAFLYKKALDRKQVPCIKTETDVSCDQPNLDIAFGSEEKICRICCKNGDIPLSSELFGKTVADCINECSEITVSSSDGFPKWLCVSCCKLLKNAVEFREMARLSTAKLISVKMEEKADDVPFPGPIVLPVKLEEYNTDEDGAWPMPCTPLPPSPLAELAAWPGETTWPEVEGGRWEDNTTPNCKTCREDFRDIIEYRNHLSTCSQLKSDLKSHSSIFMNKRKRRKSHKSGPFLCEICGKSLGKRHSLDVHRVTHWNIFPFKCEQCPYRGRTKDLLRTHKRSHLAVRPFSCPKCPLRFISASNRNVHILRHGQPEPQECPQCGKTFSSKLSVTRHIKSIHIGTPPVHCDVCGKGFRRQKNLHKHRLKTHNIKSERTGRLPSYLMCPSEDTSDPQHIITDEQ